MRLTRRTAVLIAAWLVVLAGTFLLDARISAWAQQAAPEGTWTRRVLKVARYPFKWYVYLAVAGALALHNQRRRLLTGFAVACAGGFGAVHLLKFMIGRARPDEQMGVFHFDRFSHFDSLPSAHTTAAVLLTAVLYQYSPRSAWLLGPLAILASLSRVVQGRHFLSDVIAAGGITLLGFQLCVYLLGHAFYPRLTCRAPAAIV